MYDYTTLKSIFSHSKCTTGRKTYWYVTCAPKSKNCTFYPVVNITCCVALESSATQIRNCMMIISYLWLWIRRSAPCNKFCIFKCRFLSKPGSVFISRFGILSYQNYLSEILPENNLLIKKINKKICRC